MRTKRNRLQLCLLAALLLLPAMVQAQFTFTTNNGAITITGYTGSNGVVMIPGTIADLPVTSIGDWAFYSTSVTNVLIPDSVTNIGDGAFFDCVSLTNVTIGNSVISIGDWTFAFCPNLIGVCCRGDAPGLGGGNVFYGNLATIYYLSGATNWGPMFDGHLAVLWNPEVPFTYTTNSDGITLTITGYTGSDGAVTIPNSINFLPVTSIGDWAFYFSSITNVRIPDSIVNIGIYGFAYCYYLTNVTIGRSVTNTGSGAFIYSTSLATITVDAGNTFFSSVDGVLFNQSQTLLVQVPEGKIGSYTIPDTVTSIGVLAFVNCTSLTNVMIPNSVINIEYAAFVNCIGLTDILIPNGVTSIGVQAFSDCRRLANITIGSGVTNIGENAFLYCARLTAIMVDASNSSFSSVAGVLFNRSQTLLVQFPGAQGGNYSITNTVTSVGNGAFITCPYLTSVTIPNSVTNIGVNAFYDCTSLTNVAIPDSVISIGNFAFMECTSLRDVTIPDSVRNISEYMFYNCSSLTSVTIPDNVTNIGILAFERCASLTGFTVPNGVTSIADDTFWGCLSLTNVTIPNSVTNIGREAFYLCLSLTSVTIPNSVTRIGDNTFAGCAGLKGAFFNGNAPGFLGSDIFFNVPVIVYYLPGTTGWDDFALLTGVPTALWLPQMQTLGASFGVQTNEFGFNIQWASGQTVVVEACTNLVNPDWLPVQTNMLTTGSAYFSDPQWTNYPGRFYRLRSP